MNSKTLFIYNSSTLFEILSEIKEILTFKVYEIKNNELDKHDLSKFENCLIISDSKNDNALNLTEKETELILFILENKNVNLKDLQKNVWKHTSELETHTVETHVYRLRKKIVDKFQDDNFINHGKKGYYLN